jgi:hypothetical protein
VKPRRGIGIAPEGRQRSRSLRENRLSQILSLLRPDNPRKNTSNALMVRVVQSPKCFRCLHHCDS